jgi:hypothetical protein
MFKLSSLVLASLFLVGCPKKGGDAVVTAPTGGGGGAPAAAFGGTMADAPMHELGATVSGALGCRESLYAKWNIPQGQAAKMTVTIAGPAGSCASVAYLKGNGGAVDGMMKELCIDKAASETWDITGQEGGSFIQQTEAVPCKGATITIVAQ